MRILMIVAILALLVACGPKEMPAAPTAPVPVSGTVDVESAAAEIGQVAEDLSSLEEEMDMASFEDDLAELDSLDLS